LLDLALAQSKATKFTEPLDRVSALSLTVAVFVHGRLQQDHAAH
jgi:hypothetical protein